MTRHMIESERTVYTFKCGACGKSFEQVGARHDDWSAFDLEDEGYEVECPHCRVRYEVAEKSGEEMLAEMLAEQDTTQGLEDGQYVRSSRTEGDVCVRLVPSKSAPPGNRDTSKKS